MPKLDKPEEKEGLKIEAYLWSFPEMPHWQRLFFFWFYIPVLIWAFMLGKPVLICKWVSDKEGGWFIDHRWKNEEAIDRWKELRIRND